MEISNLIPMNLQLFGNGGAESSASAEPVGAVDPQPTEPTSNPVQTNNVDPVAPQQDPIKPVQTPEENAKYAAIRREAEAKAQSEAQKIIDAEYDRLYGEQYGIHTKADYDKAVAEYEEQQRLASESQRMQASPELLKEIEELKAFKNETLLERQQRQQQEQIVAVEKEVNEIIAKAKEEGFEITGQQLAECVKRTGVASLADAYKLLKPDLDTKILKENAIKEYIENLKKGVVPVEASGAGPAVVNEAPKTFEDARKGAAAMLKASNIFKI